MAKSWMLFVVIPLSFSSFAQASRYELEYGGDLIAEYTYGAQFADTLSGTLVFDMADAVDTNPLSYMSSYKMLPGKQDFITGYAPAVGGLNRDSVNFYNADDPTNGEFDPGNPQDASDGLIVQDAHLLNNVFDSLFIEIRDDTLTWLNDDLITTFDFNDSELSEYSRAWISSEIQTPGPNGITYIQPLWQAAYDLSYARLTKVEVPEPSIFTLLSLSIAALIGNRRYRMSAK